MFLSDHSFTQNVYGAWKGSHSTRRVRHRGPTKPSRTRPRASSFMSPSSVPHSFSFASSAPLGFLCLRDVSLPGLLNFFFPLSRGASPRHLLGQLTSSSSVHMTRPQRRFPGPAPCSLVLLYCPSQAYGRLTSAPVS